MSFSIKDLRAQYQGCQYDLNERYLNRQMVKVLRTIGYDKNYQKAVGQYLYDQDNNEYLDLLSGFGVFAIGRNHPTVIQALHETMTLDLPNLVQMDVSWLSGLLAKEILATLPEHFTRMFFCVAVLRGDPTMISTCLEKLGEIHPLRARLFSCFSYPIVYRPFSGLMRCMAAARCLLTGHRRVQPKHLSNGAKVLEVEPAFWESYLKAASSLA
jgi:hypothetical protein